MLERWFKVRERGLTVRVELLGGATTFIKMAYLIAVAQYIGENAFIASGLAALGIWKTLICYEFHREH